MKNRVRVRRLATVGVSVAFLLGLVAFSYFAAIVDRFPGDVAASDWVQSWRTGWLDTALEIVSVVGIVEVAAVLVGVAAGALFILGRRAEAGVLVAASVLGHGLGKALKVIIARPRPPADLVRVIEQTDGHSFPSGHVMFYVLFLGVLTVLLLPTIRPTLARRLVLGGLVVVLIVIGFSRIYLGVHWLSDVVAGYAFGLAVVTLTTLAWTRWSQARASSPVAEDD